MMLADVGDAAQLVMYFTSLDNVKLRRPVKPGDQLRLEIDMVQRRGRDVQDPRRRARGRRDRVRSGHGRHGPRPMTVRIHPTALVSADAQIGKNVEIGAFAIIGPECVIGDGCVIAPRATLEKLATLAANVKVGSGSIVGGDPQDLKFQRRAHVRRDRRGNGHPRVRDDQSRHGAFRAHRGREELPDHVVRASRARLPGGRSRDHLEWIADRRARASSRTASCISRARGHDPSVREARRARVRRRLIEGDAGRAAVSQGAWAIR